MGAAHLGNLERGQSNATLETLKRIALALDTEVWLLYWHKPKTKP